jgi:hypothetical protein
MHLDDLYFATQLCIAVSSCPLLGELIYCIFLLKNHLLSCKTSGYGNLSEPSSMKKLDEYSNTEAIHTHFRPNIHPIYHLSLLLACKLRECIVGVCLSGKADGGTSVRSVRVGPFASPLPLSILARTVTFLDPHYRSFPWDRLGA